MSLLNHYKPSVRMEYEELDGLIRLFEQKLEDDDFGGDEIDRTLHIGALMALKIIRNNHYVDYPYQFMDLFNHYADVPTDEREE